MLNFIARLCSKKSWREHSALSLWNPGRCHSDMGIPIPKTLVIWASPVTLTIIAKIRWDGDAHISLWFWEWGCPKRGDAHIPLTAPSVLPNSPRGYATLPHIKHADVTISPATQAKMCHLVEKYLVFSSHFADYVYGIERCVTCLTFHPNLKIFSLWFKVNLNCYVINRFNFT